MILWSDVDIAKQFVSFVKYVEVHIGFPKLGLPGYLNFVCGVCVLSCVCESWSLVCGNVSSA